MPSGTNHKSLLDRLRNRTASTPSKASDRGDPQQQTVSSSPYTTEATHQPDSVRASEPTSGVRAAVITTDTNYKPTNHSCLWTMQQILTHELSDLALTLVSLPEFTPGQTSATASQEVLAVFNVCEKLLGIENWVEEEKVRATDTNTLKGKYKGDYDTQLEQLSSLVSSKETKAEIAGLISLGNLV